MWCLVWIMVLFGPVWIRLEFHWRERVDHYGWSQEEKLSLATKTVEAITQNRVEELESLELKGKPIYNSRELVHLEDVARWYKRLENALVLIIVLVLITLLVLVKQRKFTEIRRWLWTSGITGLGLMGITAGFVILAWDWVFEWFHLSLFEEGTYLFYETDSLIRLFPEEYWIDSAKALIGLAAFSYIAMVGFGRMRRKSN